MRKSAQDLGLPPEVPLAPCPPWPALRLANGRRAVDHGHGLGPPTVEAHGRHAASEAQLRLESSSKRNHSNMLFDYFLLYN